jgi:hypothetical protein
LRDYVDALYYRMKADRRKRKRVFDESQYAPGEETAPLNAPRWTKSGYNGTMRKCIIDKTSEINDNNTIAPESPNEEEQRENNSETDENGTSR